MGGSQASRITYTLESSLDSVNRVEQTAEEMARKAGLEEEEIYRVAMAVREAAVNAVSCPSNSFPSRATPRTVKTPNMALVERSTHGSRRFVARSNKLWRLMKKPSRPPNGSR